MNNLKKTNERTKITYTKVKRNDDDIIYMRVSYSI